MRTVTPITKQTETNRKKSKKYVSSVTSSQVPKKYPRRSQEVTKKSPRSRLQVPYKSPTSPQQVPMKSPRTPPRTPQEVPKKLPCLLLQSAVPPAQFCLVSGSILPCLWLDSALSPARFRHVSNSVPLGEREGGDVANERPGNCSCDLHGPMRGLKKCKGNGHHTDRRTSQILG